MTDEELREKVVKAISPWYHTLDTAARVDVKNRADRAIALCREHYGGEIERLRRERDEARDEAVMWKWQMEAPRGTCTGF